jgi:hypothetical protein
MGLIGVPLMLCLLALAAVAASWRLQSRNNTTLSNRQLFLFRSGAILGALGLFVTATCFVDLFPLTRHSDGSLSISWLDRAWSAAFILAFASAGLAMFGRGKARILLVASQVFSILLTCASLLQNGV